MKKPILLLILAFSFSMATACTGGASATETPTPSEVSVESVSEPESVIAETPEVSEPQPEEEPAPVPEPAGNQNPFESMEVFLGSQGIEYDITRMGAELVGAEEGYKYNLADGGRVEVYQFDKDTEAWAESVSAGQLFMEGFGGFDAYFNEEAGLALLLEGVDVDTYTGWLGGM